MGLPLTKAWTDISDLVLEPGKAVTSTLLYALRDNQVVLMESLGGSYKNNFSYDHIHDGVGSALIDVGPNLLRNGSFESGEDGWTITDYSGGSHALSTTQDLHGAYALSFTGTVLAQGGGNALTTGYLPCGTGQYLLLAAIVQASIAGISSKVQVIWYDSAENQISSTDYFNTASTPVSAQQNVAVLVPPANARFCKVNAIGGVPGSGTAVGTVTFDGLYLTTGQKQPVFAGNTVIARLLSITNPLGAVPSGTGTSAKHDQVGNSATPVELFNARIHQDGKYRVGAACGYSPSTDTISWRVYKNGAAAGVTHSFVANGNWGAAGSDDIQFSAGDTVQIFGWSSGGPVEVADVWVGIDPTAAVLLVPPQSIMLGER